MNRIRESSNQYVCCTHRYKRERDREKAGFSKKYRAEELLTEQSTTALAQGMSTAMKRVSEQILKDIYSYLQKPGK